MATKQVGIAEDVKDVLRGASVQGTQLKLNSGQLDPKLYKRVDEVLKRLGGKWQGGKTMAHVFPADLDPRVLLDGVLGGGVMPAKNPLDFFETPRVVAERMLDLAGLSEPNVMNVLEPSAGEGALARVVRSQYPDAFVQCVELDHTRAGRLREEFSWDGKVGILEADFMGLSLDDLGTLFDLVVMNPPFTSTSPTAYMEHIYKAAQHLKPGGRLVAVTPSGWGTTQTQACRGFKAYVERLGHWTPVVPGAFKESGTGVNCAIVVIEKRPDQFSVAHTASRSATPYR